MDNPRIEQTRARRRSILYPATPSRPPPQTPLRDLPAEERLATWVLSCIIAALIGAAFFAEGVAIVYSRVGVVVDDGGGRVP